MIWWYYYQPHEKTLFLEMINFDSEKTKITKNRLNGFYISILYLSYLYIIVRKIKTMSFLQWKRVHSIVFHDNSAASLTFKLYISFHTYYFLRLYKFLLKIFLYVNWIVKYKEQVILIFFFFIFIIIIIIINFFIFETKWKCYKLNKYFFFLCFKFRI